MTECFGLVVAAALGQGRQAVVHEYGNVVYGTLGYATIKWIKDNDSGLNRDFEESFRFAT